MEVPRPVRAAEPDGVAHVQENGHADPARARADSETLTVGVEEEFQLLDAVTGELASRGDDLLAVVPPAVSPAEVTGELPLSQVEIATPVCRSLDEVRTQLVRLRGVAAAAAAEVGCQLAASGSPPAGRRSAQRVADDERYAPLRRGMRGLVDDQFIAGLHVHVGVADRDRGVAVLDRIRVWLPALVALTGNSPFWFGEDTGFQSWRTVHWWRWPVSGPTPLLGSAAGYDATVAGLIATSVLHDPGKVYWDARLSARYPTVELRATDVPMTVDESVLVAGLARALARTALRDYDAGRPAPVVAQELLRSAMFLAARDGLRGRLPHPTSPTDLLPAGEVVGLLLDEVADALEERGDLATVRAALADVRARGTGADRQRGAFAAGGPAELTALLVRETMRGGAW